MIDNWIELVTKTRGLKETKWCQIRKGVKCKAEGKNMVGRGQRERRKGKRG